MGKGFPIQVSISVFAVLAIANSSAFAQGRLGSRGEHAPGEIIVKLKARGGLDSFNVNASLISTLQVVLGVQSVVSANSFMTDRQLTLFKIADDAALVQAITTLQGDPRVQYAEPNYKVQLLDDGIPNDPDFKKLWSMQNTGQADSSGQIGVKGADIDVLPLWARGITGSRDILVAIIDTGMDWDHPDLKDNLYTNPGEAAGNGNSGKDNDGNGFIDDIHGFNFVNHTGDTRDDQGHGTHCAGTIGGVGNNGLGIAGVNWKVSLMPVKFLDGSGGGTYEGAVEAINYARMMKVKIMSNSWGGAGGSQALEDAVKATKDAGILFVAAAGNNASDNDTTANYPSNIQTDNMVAVAATDNQDNLASFSNYGATLVHVAAPGVNIHSSVPTGSCQLCDPSGYRELSGTSMATPHVAGIAALMMSGNTKLSWSDIKSRLIHSSTPVAGLRGKSQSNGRVDVTHAFDNVTLPTRGPAETDWKSVSESLESEHPYRNNLDAQFPVQVPGAKYIRVIFDKIDTEKGYDRVIVQNSRGTVSEELSGQYSHYSSQYIEGDSATIRLKSDGSNTAYGFAVSSIQWQ